MMMKQLNLFVIFNHTKIENLKPIYHLLDHYKDLDHLFHQKAFCPIFYFYLYFFISLSQF